MVEMTEDFLAPLVRYIRGDQGIKDLNALVPDGGVNPILGPPSLISSGSTSAGYVPYTGGNHLWVFRGFSQNGIPFATVEGTGSSAITLEHTGYWGRRNRGTRLQFPEISVYYNCDVTRDATLAAPRGYDAVDKCQTIHKEIVRLFHMMGSTTGGFHLLGPRDDGSGALKVVSSTIGRDLDTIPIHNGDGMIEGRATFELEVLL